MDIKIIGQLSTPKRSFSRSISAVSAAAVVLEITSFFGVTVFISVVLLGDEILTEILTEIGDFSAASLTTVGVEESINEVSLVSPNVEESIIDVLL